MIQDVAHFLFGQTLMVSKLFSCMKVTVASIANECRGIVSLMLFNNVLSIDACQRQSQMYIETRVYFGVFTSALQIWENKSWHRNGGP